MSETRETHPAPAATDQYGQRLYSPPADPAHQLDRLGRDAQPQQQEPGRA
jgi:hypothetical protein